MDFHMTHYIYIHLLLHNLHEALTAMVVVWNMLDPTLFTLYFSNTHHFTRHLFFLTTFFYFSVEECLYVFVLEERQTGFSMLVVIV